MNPIIRAMMSRVGSKALGTAGSLGGTAAGLMFTPGEGGDLQPTQRNGQAWPWSPQGRINGAFDQLPQGPQQQGSQGPAPIDRIKAAFDAMRSQQPQPNVMNATGVAQPDANGVYGSDAVMMPQQQAPGAPMNLASHGVVNVPDLPRQQPQEEAPPQDMGFFMRNAMAQRDPEGGGYLNPEMASKAMQGMGASPFAALFG